MDRDRERNMFKIKNRCNVKTGLTQYDEFQSTYYMTQQFDKSYTNTKLHWKKQAHSKKQVLLCELKANANYKRKLYLPVGCVSDPAD